MAWAWGLISVQAVFHKAKPDLFLKLGGWTKRIRERPKKRRKPKETNKRKEAGLAACFRIASAGRYLDSRALKEGVGFALRIARSLRLKLAIEGEYGTGDPAMTGYISGMVAIVNGTRERLQLRPNYTDEVLDVQGKIRGRLIPAQILGLTGCFLLKAPVRRLWWAGLRTKVKNIRRSKGCSKKTLKPLSPNWKS
ncbi:MAG: DUF2953 domain-containing protein [Bacillota bacterium]